MQLNSSSNHVFRLAAFGTLLLSGVALPAAPNHALARQPSDAEPDGPSVTVYSTADPAGFDPQQFIAQQRGGHNPQFAWQVPGFGVVKEVRTVQVNAGQSTLRFTDVAQFIDPTTVSFTDLTDPEGTAVLEQNFEFDLVSPEKLLEKYIDRPVTVSVPLAQRVDAVTGDLLAAGQGKLVIETTDSIRIVPAQDAAVQLGNLPEGLITRPTLVWKLQAAAAGEHRVRTTYQTGGITWRADYNLILNAEDTKADIGAWVSMMNLSGAAYPNARLKLVAGDVQRVEPQRYLGRARRAMPAAQMDEKPGFEEKAFFEYHLYTLPRRTDILANTTQQITLFPTAHDVSVEKVLVYYGLPEAAYWGFGQPQQDRNFGNQSNPKVDVYVRFVNAQDNHLGMPLPAGKVRTYKLDDADGTLEFIGEDVIGHTAKDEKVLIKLGQAFDVVGERTQTNFSVDTNRKTMTESFRIQVRNHKPQPQKVVIKENLYRWSTWEITQSSDEYEKIDARTIHFDVTVPANGEKMVTYSVRYAW